MIINTSDLLANQFMFSIRPADSKDDLIWHLSTIDWLDPVTGSIIKETPPC
jgi:hypothetical protein